MLLKQCGNCKWWDKENKYRVHHARKDKSKCIYPLPFYIARPHLYETDGQDCSVYEEKKL